MVLVAAGGAALYFWAGKQVRRTDAIAAGYSGRPSPGKGTNWLLVGSDSRKDLTPEQRRKLHVGNDEGLNTDTIMLLHHGGHGPYLVSLPRDSYVQVPGHGKGKINAAFADGGPRLLTRTVEEATGLRVDHYAEVDFPGFVALVDALGGVRLCLDKPLKDEKAGADFRAGCQRMDGVRALAYVRSRYTDPDGDLGRVRRQRRLVGAVADAMLGPGVVLNPLRLRSVLDAALSAVTVDGGTGVGDLVTLGRSAKEVAGGGGKALTVPVANPGVTMGDLGDVLVWDEREARRLFEALREDGSIPTSANN
ncbi:LCP family protein [Streptomyces sp. MST-110588]|uniref:LCP family protein n=1 Tax=Streptomyces sp. MST-110588 TaxID=2833628 RepID=UPI001F5C4348|nr:LCP family protein [Streptomyces sp. MST-110588]